MRTVREVSKITGVSIRTLHHYDAIGLLKPTEVTEAGYRLYDDAALRRLNSILLFRELEFPLKEIRSILDDPAFDAKEALADQIELLKLQREHIDGLIDFARKLQAEGGAGEGRAHMAFDAFDKSKLEEYREEAREKWGKTAAWQEFEKKEAASAGETAGSEMMAFFAAFGGLRNTDPTAEAAQAKVKELQSFITEHYYTCTDEILAGLGKLYTADERFRKNIDKAGGEGTAEFVSRAIEAYCR